MTDLIKILILEDNQSDADLLLRELKKNRLNCICEVVETKDAYEKALYDFNPDLILSDYYLPSFDGLKAFHIKQEKFPDKPFIMVSGTLGDERAVELIKSGVTDYALKDKLFALTPKIHRALKDADERTAKRIADDQLKQQYDKLLKIAFLQSHQVRVPIANMLGLFDLFNFNDPTDHVNAEVLSRLKTSALSLDRIIMEIVEQTNNFDTSKI